MNTVKRTKELLDEQTNTPKKGEVVQEAFPVKEFKIEDLAKVAWKKLSASDSETFAGVESDNARIAEIKDYIVLVDGNRLTIVMEDGSELLYDFDEIKPVKLGV